MSDIIFTINAILPIVLIILVGYFITNIKVINKVTGEKENFLSEKFLLKGNKLVFSLFLPTYLFFTLYNIKSLDQIHWDVTIFVLLGLIFLFGFGLFLGIILTKDGKKRGVITQACFRSNYAIIGITLARALGGAEGEQVMAIVVAFGGIMINVLGILSLTLFVGNDENGIKKTSKQLFFKIVKDILTNALIIAILLGILVLGIRSFIPLNEGELVFSIKNDLPFIYEVMRMLSVVATPFALVIAGGLFRFSAAKGVVKELVAGSIVRLVIAPVLLIFLAYMFNEWGIVNFNNAVYPCLIAMFATPVSVTAALVASSMGSDTDLANQYVFWTSVASVVTLFLTILICKNIGLIG